MRPRLVLVVAMVAALASPAHADTTEEYRLGADDVIEIAVLNHPDMDRTLSVLPDGTVTYSWVGRLQAAGKTPKALAGDIRQVLEKTMNNVDVSVAVKEVRSHRVRIVGAVKSPGGYDVKPGWRFLDLVAVAGGFSGRPARISGRIIRGGQMVPLDVVGAGAQPDSDANPLLQTDDLVLLDERDPAQDKVYVMGQVARPGAYDLGDEGISLLSLISQAGNTTDDAALTRAYVLRGTTQIPLNLRPLLVQGTLDEGIRSFRVQAGDVLFIPQIEQRIAVMGQVNRPGYYPLSETKRVTALDALSLAGGQTSTGDLRRAGIIRTVDGVPKVLSLDIEAMLRRGDMVANAALQADDVLYIPPRGERRFTWEKVLGSITALTYLGFRPIR